MRVAVIGGGIAGLATAWLLKDVAEVVLYEREPRLGGHAHSIAVVQDDVTVWAEAGFKFMFDRTHPRVLALIRTLGLRTRRRQLSMTIRFPDDTHVRFPPRSGKQAALLVRDGMARRGAAALLSIGFRAGKIVREADWSLDLGSYLRQRFAEDVCDRFLLPLCAASWGMSVDVVSRFPAHDVLKVIGSSWAGFLEVVGGNAAYIEALVAELAGVEVRRGVEVHGVRREGGELVVESQDTRRFDQVVLATPANRTGTILSGMPEAAALCAACARFGYVDTEIVIHGDTSWMPPDRREWSVVNYRFEEGGAFTTEWCGQREERDVFRSWLLPGRAPPRAIWHRQKFEHLVMTSESLAAQRELARLQGQHGLWLAGMYTTDVDIHESSLASAVEIARRLSAASSNLRRLERMAAG